MIFDVKLDDQRQAEENMTGILIKIRLFCPFRNVVVTMETENQLAVLHQSTNSGGSDMDTSPLCLQKNKRKNFNPRFAESKDDEQQPSLKLKVEATSESEKEDDAEPNPVTFASLMAAGACDATAKSEAEMRFRDFAFKTMQELLNIYGMPLTFGDVVDAFKQQQQRMREGKRLKLHICATFSCIKPFCVSAFFRFFIQFFGRYLGWTINPLRHTIQCARYG